MGVNSTWNETHLIIGDQTQLNITWIQDNNPPTTQPSFWHIRAQNNSGGAAFFETTIPCTPSQPGAQTTDSLVMVPTTWGYATGSGHKYSDFLITPLNASGNSMGSSHGTGLLEFYEMPTISVTASPSTVTSVGQTVTFSWSVDKNLDQVSWDRNYSTTNSGTPYSGNGSLWRLLGNIPGQPRSGSFQIIQGQTYYGQTIIGSTSQTYDFEVSHSSQSPIFVPTDIASRLYEDTSVTVNVAIPVYGIGAARTLYTEGESMYCAVSTTNVAAGTTVYWAIEGITGTLNASDFVDPINGGFQVDSNGGFTWSVGINDDTTAESGEMFKLKLYTDAARTNEVAESVIITILTSDQPVYGIATNKTSYAEGETITCAVTTSNVAAGTTVYWEIDYITASLVNGDFAGSPRSGGFQLDANGGYTWTTASFDDSTPEGAESFRLKLHSDYARTNLLAESSVITIEASDNVAYSITANKTTYNEGETIYIGVGTEDVPTGTTLYWRINGAAIDGNDFIGTDLGSGVTDANGGFNSSRQITNDLSTEQTETFLLQLFTDSFRLNKVAESGLHYINDTSINVAYSIIPTKTFVNEGEIFGYGVGASSNVPLGTVIYWALEGVGITANDFIPASLTGSGTVVATGGGNRGFSVTKTLRADSTTEGGELVYFRICTDAALTNIIATNTEVYFNDTSIDPPPSITFTAFPTTINPGSASRLTWNVTNVNSGGNAVSINQGVGSIPSNSFVDVYPTVNTTYTLSAIGPGGTSVDSVTVNMVQLPSITATGPTQLDWEDTNIPINITATNSPGISLLETYDGVAKPPVSLPNSSGSVNWTGNNVYNYVPDWSSPVETIQLHFTCGSDSAFVVMSVGVDKTPDPINIPSNTGEPNEEFISPLIPVEVDDIDVPVEIKANLPIKVEIDASGTWQNIRQS
tara:strand:- start:4128 stop:6896 length:2769 start_codon:yes stop_codon:yes gene_type:complete